MEKKSWGGSRKGAGRIALEENNKKKGIKIYLTDDIKEDVVKYGCGKNFSDKIVEIISMELQKRKLK